MRATRKLITATALAALLGGIALSAAACKDDSKGGASAAVKAAFAVFPADTDAVIGIHPPHLRKSALYSMIEPMAARQVGSEFEQLRAACGADPLELVQTVILGVDQEGRRGVAVVQGLDRDGLTKCGEGLAKAKGEQIVIAHDGKFTKIVSDGETTHLAWLDDKTFILGKDMEREQLAERAEGKNGLDGDKEMMNLLRNVDSRATVWMVGRADQPVPVREGGMNADISAAFGTIALGSGLKVDVGARTASGEQATETAEQLKAFAGFAKLQFPQLSSLEIKSRGSDVIVQLNMSKADLTGLIDKVQSDPMIRKGVQSMMGGGGDDSAPPPASPEAAQ